MIFFLLALQKKRIDTNSEACDMWSFAILLWELATREVPFSQLSPMEIGMKVWLYLLFMLSWSFITCNNWRYFSVIFYDKIWLAYKSRKVSN